MTTVTPVTRMDRLVLGEMVGLFLGCVILFTSLILAAGELIKLAQYLQSGESALLVAKLLGFTLPQIVALTFPLAILLAALLGMGRLSSDSELVALVAAGVSFERIMVPVGAFGLLVSLIGIWFSNSVVPWANAGRQNIYDAINTRGAITFTQSTLDQTLRDKQSGRVLHLHAEGGISFGQDRSGAATIHNLTVEIWQNGKLSIVAYADRADWKVGTNDWVLGGNTYGADFSQSDESGSLVFRSLDQLHLREQPFGKPDELQTLRDTRVDTVSTSDLRVRSRLFRRNGDITSAREADVEAARRFAMPFASFVFALIGAALGVRSPRAGAGAGFGIAILLTFAYWSLLQLFTVIGRGGTVPPWLAVMVPNLLCLAVAAWLIHRKSHSLS